MKTIKTKLIAIYAAVVLVVMSGSGTFILWTVRNMEVWQTQQALLSHASAINEQIVQVNTQEGFWGAPEWLILGQSEYGIEGVLLDDLGIPIAPEPFVLANIRFNDRSLKDAMLGVEGFNVGSRGLHLNGFEQTWFTFAMPVTVDDDTFIIYTRVSTRVMDERLSSLTFYLVMMVLVSLVVTVVFWFFLSNTITDPILALTRHAKAIAGGDFSHEIKVQSNDEIGQLAYNFNYMAHELRATLSRVASEKNKREAFLQNTSHGVLAYDAPGTLIHANNASAELLQGVDINSLHVRQALELLDIDPEDVFALQPGEVRESVYKDGESFLAVTATSYTDETGEVDGYVLVLQDITRQRKLDNMRKEFVANVSHELRTPLTSIATYTETLIEGALDDSETAMEFLKVVNDEARRMSVLVSDLLELSRIDSKHMALEMDVVDLVALINLSLRQGQILADKKGQRIELDMPGTPCFIEANAARINQVVSNIVSNSIKYSPPGTIIKVTMETTEKYYRIFIQDEGMGIPPESLGRIFERFYRVDKARSRAMGGTGLGLAIVKEIMEEHGGRVHASSHPGQGTTMVLRFNRLVVEEL